MINFKEYLKEVKEPTGKLKDACWSGYTAVGMKMKNGKKVPNCVPQNEEVQLDEAIDPSEVAQMPSSYNAADVKKAYYHKNASQSDKESLARHLDRYHGNKEWRKAIKESTAYEDSEENLKSAESAKKQGDMFAHHLHMADYHDNLSQWHAERGRHGESNKHAEKSNEHHEKAMGFKEEVELDEAAVDAKGYKSSTGGLTQKGRDAYNRKEGSNLKAPVTTPPSKLKAGSKAANRRKSFCARMSGVEGPMKKPNGEPTRKALALRKWNC